MGTASLPAAEKGPPLKRTRPSAFPGRRRQPASTLLVAWPLASHVAPPDPDGQERTSPTGTAPEPGGLGFPACHASRQALVLLRRAYGGAVVPPA